jgi:type VI secretion system secreted protein VgrG
MSGSSAGSSIDFLSITTPLAAGSFVIRTLSGEERLSRPFYYHVMLDAGAAKLDPNDLLDKPVTVTIGDADTDGRYLNAIVQAVRQVPVTSENYWTYELTLVPKFWFLGQTQDCRFYQQMTVPDIVSAILGAFNVTVSKKLQNSYVTRDYVVMFNESYRDFVQRLLEEEGIFYYFTHDDSTHTLVLADNNSAFADVLSPSVSLQTGHTGFNVLGSWYQETRTALGVVRHDDYNPATDALAPGAITGAETTVLDASGAGGRTYYAWPAVRTTTADAKTRVTNRMLAAEATAELAGGHGEVMDFYAGGKFTLSNDPLNDGGSTEYVILSVTYHAQDNADGASGGATGGGVSMSCVAFPAATTWREEPTILPPMLSGVYSAIVIGDSGEEIYTDDAGRIQVQFPADNHGDITSAKTLWVRVLHPWAGNNWGVQFTPRIGMEVAVAFQEGDVNRPVAIGCLYNNVNTPVFAASEKNKTGWRTRSTKGGGTSNFSEFSIDDTLGSELVYLHTEKDLTVEVEHDRKVTVTNDETVEVDGKKTDTIKGDFSTTVSEGNQSTTVSEGNRSVTVSQGNLATKVTAGNETLDVTAGSITHSAGQSITLKVGGNSIVINSSGITLTVGGTSVQLTAAAVDISTVNLSASGSASASVSGATVSVSGEGQVSVSAPMVMVG